jgi:hypothetical protein
LHYAANIKLLFKNQNPFIGGSLKPLFIETARRYSLYDVGTSRHTQILSFRAALARNLLLLLCYEEADSSPEKPGSE